MNWLKLLVQYLPTILQLVVSVEQTMGAGNGAAKKQVILDVLTASPPVLADGATKTASVAAIIDVVVAALNKAGALDNNGSKKGN